MGLGKWWLTHGPGSPGSIARAMAKSYLILKNAYPGAPENDLLHATLKNRYAMSGGLDQTTAQEMLEASEGSLSKLTIQVWQKEVPRSSNAAIYAPEAYMASIQVIENEISKII